jgi:putative ABC transport system permease protein
MYNLFKIAIRNLLRYQRRTLLTSSLIMIGVVFVLVFVAVTGSIKSLLTGQITDSMLGHIQIHKKGYVASIDNLPLTITLTPKAVQTIENVIKDISEVEAYSMRIKFGGLFSNYKETTNIRLNGVVPESEIKTVPLLLERIAMGNKDLKKGTILIPELLAKGMEVKVGDTIVVIATNKDGSVNGKQFIVGGILESVTGPGGRDGYIHIEDAVEVLRMEQREISEIVLRLRDFTMLHDVYLSLTDSLSGKKNEVGKPIFEVHTWESLSPFYNIARMIDIMTFFIKIMLIAMVLISIMNVMIMAVYERMREIGTISAIGTMPGKILSMFILEGLSIGIFGTLVGDAIGCAIIYILNISHITFSFGRQTGLLLEPHVGIADLFTVSVIVIIVSVVASLQPALKASRMEPIYALHHV